jgi:hypothetical protein
VCGIQSIGNYHHLLIAHIRLNALNGPSCSFAGVALQYAAGSPFLCSGHKGRTNSVRVSYQQPKSVVHSTPAAVLQLQYKHVVADALEACLTWHCGW